MNTPPEASRTMIGRFNFCGLTPRFWPIAIVCISIFAGIEQAAFAESKGAKLAQETLAQGEALGNRYAGASSVAERDKAVDDLESKTRAVLTHMSSEDRIDYSEYMANVISQARTGGTMSELPEVALAFISASPSVLEYIDGICRLLSSKNPAVRDVPDSLFGPESTRLPNGETGQDISVFGMALKDPKVPKQYLIPILFRLGPVETAQWLADHANLSPNERASLQPDLQNAWKLHRALEPSADEQTKRVLDDSIKNPLLNRWLHSPSWILRDLANGLLREREELQSGGLRAEMQPVEVPANLQMSSTDSQASAK